MTTNGIPVWSSLGGDASPPKRLFSTSRLCELGPVLVHLLAILTFKKGTPVDFSTAVTSGALFPQPFIFELTAVEGCSDIPVLGVNLDVHTCCQG